MKKLMKALALTLAMCLVLSTAAFAAIAEPTVDYGTKTLTINITTEAAADADEEAVSLVVVNAGTNIATGNILFVDQKTSENGTATFTAKIAADVTAVDVYAGNASYASANTAAQFRGQVELVEQETVVEITPATVVIANGEGEAEQGTAIGMDVNVGEENVIKKVIWGFTAGGERYYTLALDDYAGLSGSVKLAVSVLNGYKVGETPTAAMEITNPSAIFLFSDNTEAFTNADDDDNRLTVEETPAE